VAAPNIFKIHRLGVNGKLWRQTDSASLSGKSPLKQSASLVLIL